MISLNQLKTFMAVVKYGSFTRAARELNHTQPAVSGHVASLEKELGAKLFVRTGKNIVLTDEGRVLSRAGEEVLARLDALGKELADLKELRGGTITLGASKIVGVYVLTKLLMRFREKFPEIEIQLRIHSAHTVIEQLDENAYDLAIVAEGIPVTSRNVSFKVIGEEPLVIVAPPEHPLARRGTITVTEACREPFILSGSETASARSLRRPLEDLGIQLRSTVEMDDAGAIKHAVEEGAGLAVLTRCVVERELREGRLVELQMENWRPSRRLLMLWRDDRPFSRNTEAFIRFLYGCLKRRGAEPQHPREGFPD